MTNIRKPGGRWNRWGVVLLLVAMPAALVYGVVQADGDDLEFAYGTNHYNGAAYSSAMIPPVADNVYLIADVDSVVAAKLTDVYYWALTNEYKANWDAANEMVDGSLEVRQGNTLYTTIERTQYVIQYDGLDKFGTIALYTGEEAFEARRDFEDRQTAYRDALYEYNQAMIEFREDFQEALEKYQSGLISEDEFPAQPEKSGDMTLFSTEVLEGFVVNLPEGVYTIQVRLPDGSVQADSQKQLTVFSASQDGISYNILAEERWTIPEISKDINEIIYTVNDQTLYFQPYHSKQYNELYYTRMNDPQDRTARSDRSVWVPFRPVKEAVINLGSEQGIQAVDNGAYYVRQLLGSSLGYQIEEFDVESMSEPSFEGFKLLLDSGEARFFIELIDEQGQVLPGSYRQIHILSADKSWIIYVVSILPVAVGILLMILRRKKVQYVRIIRE